MKSFLGVTTRVADKTGVLGSIISAMGCAMCFPALASIGAVIGLGGLTQWESVFVHVLLPLFAVVALLANGLGWFSHHQWARTALGLLGPVLVLAGRYTFTNAVLYAGLVTMLAVAVWDLVAPGHRRCASDGCALPSRPPHP